MFTPVHSFVGGLTIAGATYELLAENGLVFGASGFFHRTIRATSRSLTSSLEPISKERDSSWSESDQLATAAIVGLVTGGVLLRIYDDQATHAFGATIFDPPSTSGLFGTVVAGFLVGYGTRVSLNDIALRGAESDIAIHASFAEVAQVATCSAASRVCPSGHGCPLSRSS
jgi:uncharacterized membrane protein YedE/YeeE